MSVTAYVGSQIAKGIKLVKGEFDARRFWPVIKLAAFGILSRIVSWSIRGGGPAVF